MRVNRSHLGLTPAEINAAVQAAASGSGSAGTTSSTSTTGSTAAAASITAAVTRAGGGTSVQSQAAALQRAGTIGAVITAALAVARGAATSAGGSTGQWISFVLGGPAPATGTTIAPGDLNTLKDWVVTLVDTAGPLVSSLRSDGNPDVATAARFFVGTDGTSGYLYSVKNAIMAAWTAAQTPAAPPAPEPAYDPGTGTGGGGGGTTQTSSEAMYLLPVGAIALAAILFFLKR